MRKSDGGRERRLILPFSLADAPGERPSLIRLLREEDMKIVLGRKLMYDSTDNRFAGGLAYISRY